MRVGRVLSVEDFPQARVPAWKLTIDFGEEIGVKRSSAQITSYTREELEGTLVVAVVNFPPRRSGRSPPRCSCSARWTTAGRRLLRPDRGAAIGSRIA